MHAISHCDINTTPYEMWGGGACQCYCRLAETYLQGSPPNKIRPRGGAHRHTKTHFAQKKPETPGVCGCERRDARNLCVLPFALCVLVRVTERAADVLTPALCSNQQGETGCGVRMGWEVKPKKKNSQCVLLLLLLLSLSFSVLDVALLCHCLLPQVVSGHAFVCCPRVGLCHTLHFSVSLCVLSTFVSCFCFYLCVTVRPFLCGSVSCV